MSILSILSAISVILLASGAGLYKSACLQQRVRILAELISMLGDMETEIRFSLTPVFQMVQKLGERRYEFLRIISRRLNSELAERQLCGLDTIWTDEANKLFSLSEDDKRILIFIGKSLGSSDVAGQLAMLQSNRIFLSGNYEQACCEYEKKGKMYRSVGVLTGILGAIILI